MRKILLGLILFGLLFSTLGYSQYRVVGSQIYNGSTPVVMKGTNVNGPNWVWGRETTQDANLIVNVWKFNIVRVNQFIYGSRLTTNNNLDLIVNTFTGLGCVVMLEVHDFTGTEPTDAQLTDLKNFWIDKANKYKGNDKVWFNIENEPVDGWNGSVSLTTRWRDVHDQCIGVIRAAGANNIVVCDDNGWGGTWVDSQSGIMTYGQFLTSKYSNVAFGVHLYDDRISVANLTAWFNSIISKGLCPIVGEFGVDNGTACPNAPSNLFSILHNTSNSASLQNVGRLSWHWASGDANRYCTTGDGNGYDVNKTDGTRPTNLVANFGGLIWDDSHTGTPANVAVTGVTMSPTSASVAVGATTQLTATVAPSNATNKSVNWSSNNTGVATVNTSGLVTGVAVGSATITVTTVDGNKTATSAINVTGGSGTSIPAKIEAESYSTMFGIVTETTTDTGGGQDVGYTDTGDWMNYSVNASAGTYTVDLRVASPNTGSQIQIKSGSTVLATVTIPNTGGWQTWQTVTSSSFSLAAGNQTLQVYASAGGWNLNWLEFKSVGTIAVTGVSVSPTSASVGVGATTQLTATVAPSNATNKSVNWSSSNTGVATVNSSGLVTGVAVGSATITVTTVDGSKTATSAITVTGGSGTSIPAKIEAESYSSMFGILTETTTDTGGGQDVGYTDTGDWMNYSVNASAGTYTVDLRVASPNTGSQIQIKSGSTVLATVTIPNTGGWQTWQTVTSSSFSLAAGNQTLQVYASAGGWNLNWLEFKSGGTSSGGNLIQNPGFETGSFSPWVNVWQSSVETGNAHTGSYSVTSWSGGSATQTVTVTPNTSYTLTFWGKLNGAGTASIYVKNYGGADLSAAITTTTYAQKTISFTTGSSNTTMLISVSAPSVLVYADDFSLTANGAASALKSASIETALIRPAQSSDIDVNVYPNPVTEQTAVWVNSSEAVNVSVNICNVMGQIVWSIKTNALGDTKIPIDLTGQAKGLYIVKVQIGDKIVSKTIVK